MGNYEKKECPLCKNEAEYYKVDSGNRKYYKCHNCRYFQISWRAEEQLAEMSDAYKETLARRSEQAPEGYLLAILMPGAQDREEDANASLVAKILPKTELPLN
jgi:hypothetical protein